MFSFALLRRIGAAALLVAAPSQLPAALPVTNAQAETVVLRPLTLINRDGLDFGTLLPAATAGTATVNPFTGAVTTTTGGVSTVQSGSSAARFVGAGSRRAPVIIRLPRNPITLTRSGGTETMAVSNWTLDGQRTRHIGANEAFEFKVGAELAVGANQAEGTYVGSFEVTVQYP